MSLRKINRYRKTAPKEQIKNILAMLGYGSRIRRESLREDGVRQASWSYMSRLRCLRRCGFIQRRLTFQLRFGDRGANWFGNFDDGDE